MGGHHHHGDGENGSRDRGDAAGLLRQAEAVCASRGQALTPLRRRVLHELATADGPLGAYDLVERLGKEKRIAPISVYRVLDFLIETGLVHRIATRNTYLPCLHRHEPDETTLFLICTRCGGVDEVVSPAVTRGLVGTAAAAGFRAGTGAVELEGECAECQAAAPAA